MPTTPFTVTAAAVKQIFETEFSTEGFVLKYDRLHESLGRKATVAGIFPTMDVPQDRDELVLEHYSEVRLYLGWPQEINPATEIDPTPITEYAERLRRAVEAAEVTASEQLWYFSVRDVTYPPDPTGNITRFHMRIKSFGNNAALVETTG